MAFYFNNAAKHSVMADLRLNRGGAREDKSPEIDKRLLPSSPKRVRNSWVFKKQPESDSDDSYESDSELWNKLESEELETKTVNHEEEKEQECEEDPPDSDRLQEVLAKLETVLERQNEQIVGLEKCLTAAQSPKFEDRKQPLLNSSISFDLENMAAVVPRKPLLDLLWNPPKLINQPPLQQQNFNGSSNGQAMEQIMKKLDEFQNAQNERTLNVQLKAENMELKSRIAQLAMEMTKRPMCQNVHIQCDIAMTPPAPVYIQNDSAWETEQLKSENTALKRQLTTVESEMKDAVVDAQRRSEHSMRSLVDQYKREIALRRKYYNQLVEIKGNIRAICRVRPPITQTERNQSSTVVFNSLDSTEITVTNSVTGRRQVFNLDCVLKPTDGQIEVFEEVRHLIGSCLDGFNVCIFAYGHTGSGKTHTMEGPEDDPGINRRALSELFDRIAVKTAQDEWKCEMSVSLLEIYNEALKDLLRKQSSAEKLEIRMQAGDLTVPGLTEVPVTSIQDVERILFRGWQHRKTSATNRNDTSSRSHAVFRVKVVVQHVLTGSKHSGHLHLVDLAGSERVSTSGADGVQLKEAQHINKSLSELGNVVSALRRRQKHVPFRNSTLTRLLQNCLSGDSKTAVIVQVAPGVDNTAESVSSLNFAQKISAIELNTSTTTSCTCSKAAGLPRMPFNITF